MPFQGDENMLVDATERAVKEEGEGDESDLTHINKKEAGFAASKPQEPVPLEENLFDDIFGGGDTKKADEPNDNYDPLGDIFGGGSSPAVNTPSSSASPFDDIFGGGSSSNTGGGMDDIFGGSQPKNAPSQAQDMFFMGGGAPAGPSYTAYEDENLLVKFKFERDPSDHSTHKITAVYSNKSGSQLDSVNMQVSVKKYLKLQLFSVSNPTLQPHARDAATQEIKIVNSQEGQSGIIFKARITYTHVASGKKVVETKVIEDLPTNY